jgi:hypothetical protein
MKGRPTWRSALLIVSMTAVLGVYLFVQAPPPLKAAAEETGTIPLRTVFALLEHENDVARQMWTEEIVEPARLRGLVFDEHWREPNSASGPLPALFLRETASQLEYAAPGLRLFLGSEHPINSANRFTGDQSTYFSQLVTDGAPRFFVDASTGMQTAMFADRAIGPACVQCHNEHGESPKTDWAVGDIMGATTWMYPQATVSTARALEMVEALRRSIRGTYATYLEKAATFDDPPRIGDGWPKQGRQLPSVDAFMRELAVRASPKTLSGLLQPNTAELVAEAPPPPPPPPAPPVPPPPKDDVLVIRAKRSTKVTVEHDGVRLVVARLRTGAMTSVTSPPPLRVQLDEPDSVALEYRGKPIAERDDIEIVGGTMP